MNKASGGDEIPVELYQILKDDVGLTQHSENWDHGIWSHHFMAKHDGETVETVSNFFWGGPPKSLQVVTAAMKSKDAYSLKEKLWPT